MSISSAQPTYSITSSDTITIDTSIWNNFSAGGTGGSSMDTITLTGGGGSASVGGLSYSYSSGVGGAGVIAQNISDISAVQFNWHQEEFVNCMPDIHRIESMCKEYPGLKIAFDKFVTTYRLVKDDYDTPKNSK